jgi:hypothetical protein
MAKYWVNLYGIIPHSGANGKAWFGRLIKGAAYGAISVGPAVTP